MSRNHVFSQGREPLSTVDSLQLQHAHGPFSFLNPTGARYRYLQPSDSAAAIGDTTKDDVSEQQKSEQYASGISYQWTSRNNRKGRHQLVVSPTTDASKAKYAVPKATNTIGHISKGLLRMFTYYPVWDISWLVAFVFTWGSVVWVINAFFVFLPLVKPSTEFNDETLTAGGVTAFIGATVFEAGSLFLMLEAVNENRAGDFGWAVHKAYEDHHRKSQPTGNGNTTGLDDESGAILRVEPGDCSHHHHNRKNLVGPAKTRLAHAEEDGAAVQDPHGKAGWVWFPSWHDLRTHYFRELGFIACLSQLFGASVFWISGFTALPGILDKMSLGLEAGIYWTPQIIGGTGFIISGYLFMLETQKKWYLPAPTVLGWHIGLWNLVGGVGFTLCPAFGYDTSSWAQYQASCSTFWGSWAFLIGSTIQLYESLEKNPVDVEEANLQDPSSTRPGQ